MKMVIFLVLIACLNTVLLAQDTAVVKDSASNLTTNLYRDPDKARKLGTFFPGAGHIYAGEYLRGYGYYVATVGTVGMGVIAFNLDRCTFSFLSASSCDPGPRWPNQLVGIVTVGAGIWTWVSSARDASRAAQRANTRHERRTILVKPLIEPVNGPNASVHVGLGVRW